MPPLSFERAYPSDRSNQFHTKQKLIVTTTKSEVVRTLLWYILLQEQIFSLQILSGEFSLWTFTGRNTMDKFQSFGWFECTIPACALTKFSNSENTYIVLILRYLHWLNLCGGLGYTNAYFILNSQDEQKWKLNSSLDGSSNIYHQNFDHARGR